MDHAGGRRRPELSEHVSMGMKTKRPYERLIHELCVNYGWCGGLVDDKPCHVDDFIPETGQVTADQFVEWVFAADSYDPRYEPVQKTQKYRKAIREIFIQRMGSETVDAAKLKWHP